MMSPLPHLKPTNESERRYEIMAYLTEAGYSTIKSEVEDLPLEQAKRIWKLIEPNWRYVAMRAGNGRSNLKLQWLSLLRKMTLLERKAKEVQK